jgi:hypothetical protein
LTPPGPIVLSVDVEGMELKVRRGKSWGGFKTDLLCIAKWEPPLKGTTKVSYFLTDQGHNLTSVTGFSSVYQSIIDHVISPSDWISDLLHAKL